LPPPLLPDGSLGEARGNYIVPQLNPIFYGKRLTGGKKCVKIEKQKKNKI
jgi:hypothetical protein